MARPFNWKPGTLARVEPIFRSIQPDRWLSLDGRVLLKGIKILVKGGSVHKPSAAQVVDYLVKVGEELKWDMPNMTTPEERGFLMWLVKTQMEQ